MIINLKIEEIKQGDVILTEVAGFKRCFMYIVSNDDTEGVVDLENGDTYFYDPTTTLVDDFIKGEIGGFGLEVIPNSEIMISRQ